MRDFQLPGRSPVFSENGMCATSHPLAAKIAVQILEAGGNAVDAAIAGAVTLGICEPQMTGLGGDCFVLMNPPDGGDIVALNGSGCSPQKLLAENIRGAGHKIMPVKGVESITIPGAVDAFCRLSRDWGKIGLAGALAPAIHYADAGVPVAPRTQKDWKIAANFLKGSAREFYLIDGQVPEIGQVFRSPKQAEVLRRIAHYGRDGFYTGEVAQDMVSSLQALGGTHTLEDFETAASEYTTPISGTYKDLELIEHPPNGQGATAILLNNILKQFDIANMEPFGSLRAHIEAEAAKLAYDARNRFLSDPNYTARLDHMLSTETALKLAKLIDPSKAMTSAKRLSESVHKDTVYITVVDNNRMAVSLIYSIFHSFGSGFASDKFGVLFQNRGAGFTLEKGHPNEAGGGKRPMHTIIPGMLKKDGKVIMPFGVMGGAYQPNGHARFVSNIADFGLHPQAAIDGPRCFSDAGVLNIERGYSEKVRQELSDLGHSLNIPDTAIGGAQAILIDSERGVLQGASDARKDGCALGF